MSTISTDNYTIGGADIWFSATVALEACASPTAFQVDAHKVGNVPNISITPDVTFVEHWVSQAGKRVRDKIMANQSSISINFASDELHQANLARFFMGTQSASAISVLQDTLSEGCAHVVINTDVGQDVTYMIPKCTLKNDGALDFGDGSDWATLSMSIEVLQLISSDTTNATVLAEFPVATAGFGKVKTTSLG